MFSNCTDKSCPGWMAAMVVGIIMYIVVTVMFMKDVLADVRMEITRNLPEGQRIIVQEFNDKDEFAMWMAARLEDDCKPGVTKINIDLDYVPVWKK